MRDCMGVEFVVGDELGMKAGPVFTRRTVTCLEIEGGRCLLHENNSGAYSSSVPDWWMTQDEMAGSNWLVIQNF